MAFITMEFYLRQPIPHFLTGRPRSWRACQIGGAEVPSRLWQKSGNSESLGTKNSAPKVFSSITLASLELSHSPSTGTPCCLFPALLRQGGEGREETGSLSSLWLGETRPCAGKAVGWGRRTTRQVLERPQFKF